MPSIYKKTVDDIVESGNHYVIQVKRNQLKLWRFLQDILHKSSPVDEFMTSERAKGALHTWLTEVYDISHTLGSDWKNAKRLIMTGKTIGEEQLAAVYFRPVHERCQKVLSGYQRALGD